MIRVITRCISWNICIITSSGRRFSWHGWIQSSIGQEDIQVGRGRGRNCRGSVLKTRVTKKLSSTSLFGKVIFVTSCPKQYSPKTGQYRVWQTSKMVCLARCSLLMRSAHIFRYQLDKNTPSFSSRRYSTRKQVLNCPDFNVELFITCYRSFHTFDDLKKIRIDVENDSSIILPISPFWLSSINIYSSVLYC